jgi:hypothetical protein
MAADRVVGLESPFAEDKNFSGNQLQHDKFVMLQCNRP